MSIKFPPKCIHNMCFSEIRTRVFLHTTKILMGSTNHNPDKAMQYQKIIRTKANKLKKNNSIYTKKKK
jgi:hypothetical protein